MMLHEVNVCDDDAFATMTDVESGKAPLVVLPLIPLMRNGENDEVIRRWIVMASTEAVESRRNALGVMVKVFAEATDCAAIWEKALEGWNMKRSLVWEELERDAKEHGENRAREEAKSWAREEAKSWAREEMQRAREQAQIEGVSRALLTLLNKKFGSVPTAVNEAIQKQTDFNTLSEWNTIAALASTFDEFRQTAQLP